MGQLVFVLGRSGTGKSYSMRNFPPEKFAVVNVQGKILPFRGAAKIETTSVDQSDKIVKALEIYAKDYKSIVVDDYQYVMANEFMRRSTERGYDKFTDIGRHAWDIANTVRELPDDVIVYVMCHVDRDDEGNEKIKTIGKLLDEKICLEGMSTIVLKTNVTDGVYSFLTQNNGKDTTKSPHGMFPSYAIDNDLYYVDQKIRNYYGFTGSLTDEEMTEIDKTAANTEVPFGADDKKRRGRRSAKKEEPAETPAKEEKTEAATTVEAGTEKDMDNNSEPATEQPVPAENSRRRRSRSDSGKTREQVDKENMEAIAESNIDENDDREEIPYEESEVPELQPRPRRRKERSEDVMPEPEAPVEEPAEEPTEETTPRRRRRRA